MHVDSCSSIPALSSVCNVRHCEADHESTASCDNPGTKRAAHFRRARSRSRVAWSTVHNRLICEAVPFVLCCIASVMQRALRSSRVDVPGGISRVRPALPDGPRCKKCHGVGMRQCDRCDGWGARSLRMHAQQAWAASGSTCKSSLQHKHFAIRATHQHSPLAMQCAVAEHKRVRTLSFGSFHTHLAPGWLPCGCVVAATNYPSQVMCHSI